MAYLKKKNKKNTLFDFLFFVSFSAGFLIALKTQSLKYGLVVFLCCLAVNITVNIAVKKYRYKKILASGIYDIDRMDGEKFEEYMLAWFRSQGYSGYLTRTSGDYGADLVIEKRGVKMVVQAKCWKSHVGIASVQQIVGAIKHYKAHKGLVVINNIFTKNAISLANSNEIELWDRNYIINNMKKIPRNSIPNANTNVNGA